MTFLSGDQRNHAIIVTWFLLVVWLLLMLYHRKKKRNGVLVLVTFVSHDETNECVHGWIKHASFYCPQCGIKVYGSMGSMGSIAMGSMGSMASSREDAVYQAMKDHQYVLFMDPCVWISDHEIAGKVLNSLVNKGTYGFNCDPWIQGYRDDKKEWMNSEWVYRDGRELSNECLELMKTNALFVYDREQGLELSHNREGNAWNREKHEPTIDKKGWNREKHEPTIDKKGWNREKHEPTIDRKHFDLALLVVDPNPTKRNKWLESMDQWMPRNKCVLILIMVHGDFPLKEAPGCSQIIPYRWYAQKSLSLALSFNVLAEELQMLTTDIPVFCGMTTLHLFKGSFWVQRIQQLFNSRGAILMDDHSFCLSIKHIQTLGYVFPHVFNKQVVKKVSYPSQESLHGRWLHQLYHPNSFIDSFIDQIEPITLTYHDSGWNDHSLHLLVDSLVRLANHTIMRHTLI